MAMTDDPKSNRNFLEGLSRAEDLEDAELEEEREATPTPPVADDRPMCPRCGWRNTRRSHTKGVVDLVLRTFSVRAFRCRTCGNRFRVMRRAAKA
jgi:hypothetical protein